MNTEQTSKNFCVYLMGVQKSFNVTVRWKLQGFYFLEVLKIFRKFSGLKKMLFDEDKWENW